MNPEEYGRSVSLNTKGWISKPNMVTNTFIESQLVFSEYEMSHGNVDEQRVKEMLCNNLVKELYHSDMLEFEVQKEFNHQIAAPESVFRARLNVADMKCTNSIRGTQVFKIGDEEFTDDEITEALTQTFPERLI